MFWTKNKKDECIEEAIRWIEKKGIEREKNEKIKSETMQNMAKAFCPVIGAGCKVEECVFFDYNEWSATNGIKTFHSHCMYNKD